MQAAQSQRRRTMPRPGNRTVLYLWYLGGRLPAMTIVPRWPFPGDIPAPMLPVEGSTASLGICHASLQSTSSLGRSQVAGCTQTEKLAATTAAAATYHGCAWRSPGGTDSASFRKVSTPQGYPCDCQDFPDSFPHPNPCMRPFSLGNAGGVCPGGRKNGEHLGTTAPLYFPLLLQRDTP